MSAEFQYRLEQEHWRTYQTVGSLPGWCEWLPPPLFRTEQTPWWYTRCPGLGPVVDTWSRYLWPQLCFPVLSMYRYSTPSTDWPHFSSDSAGPRTRLLCWVQLPWHKYYEAGTELKSRANTRNTSCHIVIKSLYIFFCLKKWNIKYFNTNCIIAAIAIWLATAAANNCENKVAFALNFTNALQDLIWLFRF